MSRAQAIVYSVLDLAPILAGSTAADSFRNSVDLARHAERWGYHRYWLAEHHNIPGVASAATSVLIGHIAGATDRIRVGAGGIMLPNHAPLLIAEQFGTLESLYPGRIDLGLGRAPGGDAHTAQALRRSLGSSGDTFVRDAQELRNYFRGIPSAHNVRAIPGEGLDIPIYLLGSSDFGARLAAEWGLPYAFASHFAPDYVHAALDLYRSNFKASEFLSKPYVMIGANVFVADEDAQARKLFTSLQQQFVSLVRRTPGQVPPPVDSMEGRWSAVEEAHVRSMTRYSAVGAPDIVRRELTAMLAETNADEIVVTAQIYDHTARLRSFELAADVCRSIDRAVYQ